MKYKVLIDPLAKQDMKEIFLYVVSNNNISSTDKLLDSIETTIVKFEQYP
ncbi:MAG: hypothetical protein Q8N03_08400 [Ignavibacteria bacterium]|nr:hypothetical protein [Ignavibacteria bacterium]